MPSTQFWCVWACGVILGCLLIGWGEQERLRSVTSVHDVASVLYTALLESQAAVWQAFLQTDAPTPQEMDRRISLLHQRLDHLEHQFALHTADIPKYMDTFRIRKDPPVRESSDKDMPEVILIGA